MKATEQYFPVVLFIMLYKVLLTFESVDEILKCDHSNESYWAELSSGYHVIQVRSNFWNKKGIEQYFYVVIFIFYLDGLVIWPRHNFPIIKLDTEYSCIMAPESKESLSNYPSKFKEIQHYLNIWYELKWSNQQYHWFSDLWLHWSDLTICNLSPKNVN